MCWGWLAHRWPKMATYIAEYLVCFHHAFLRIYGCLLKNVWISMISFDESRKSMMVGHPRLKTSELREPRSTARRPAELRDLQWVCIQEQLSLPLCLWHNDCFAYFSGTSSTILSFMNRRSFNTGLFNLRNSSSPVLKLSASMSNQLLIKKHTA